MAGKDVERRAAETELEKAKKDPKTRVDAGINLLLSGASFADIARLLEYESPRRAQASIERALAAGVTVEDKELLRKIQTMRYERLLKSVMPRATDSRDTMHLAYNARANALVDRISKLHGIDAPIQVEVRPTEEYLLSYAAQFKQALGLDDSAYEEPDIIEEADYVNDVEIAKEDS